MLNKLRYAILATLATVVLTAGFAGGCTQEKETLKLPYVEWA